MTTSPELQNAQDMLTALLNQRNASQNECVQLAAQVIAEKRANETERATNAELTAKVSALEAKIKELGIAVSRETPVEMLGKPAANSNGRDPEFEAVMQ